MSDKIKWEPDENGVPMCNKECQFMSNTGDADTFEPVCAHPVTEALIYDLQTCPMICYPKMVKRAAAMQAALAWYDAPVNDAERGTLSDAMNTIREAVTP